MCVAGPSTLRWHRRRLPRPAPPQRPALPPRSQDAKPVQTAARTTLSMPCSVRTAAMTSPPERCRGHWSRPRRPVHPLTINRQRPSLWPRPLAMAARPRRHLTGLRRFGLIRPGTKPSKARIQCPPPDFRVLCRSKSILVGRTSRSRNIHPQIDCESDSGVSRRQTQLTTDGSRWWVEDLDSANGTFVAAATDPIPSNPIPVGVKHELAADDRIYVGAWTRIVIRPATEDEKTALG
jgi:hypothetical protein